MIAHLNSLRFTTAKYALAGVMLTLAGCQTAPKSNVSVNYYTINGNSTAALDQDIKRRGPMLNSGRHAVAVARISMLPNVRFTQLPKGCVATRAKIAVNAKVTLPSWEGRKRASPELGRAWDNIDKYTRMHEAIHVAMAFRYAEIMEKEILAIPPAANCKLAKQMAQKKFRKLLAEHDAAQKSFDAREAKRLAKNARALEKRPKS